MNHIHESTMSSFSGKKKAATIPGLWTAVSFARLVNYSSRYNLPQKGLLWWAAFHMGQFKQHANLLRTLSKSGVGNKWSDICEDEMEDQKNWNCLVGKKKKKEDWGKTWQQFTNRWEREGIFFSPCHRQKQKEVTGLNWNKKRFTSDIGKNFRGASTAVDLPGERRMASLEVSKDGWGKPLSELLR